MNMNAISLLHAQTICFLPDCHALNGLNSNVTRLLANLLPSHICFIILPIIMCRLVSIKNVIFINTTQQLGPWAEGQVHDPNTRNCKKSLNCWQKGRYLLNWPRGECGWLHMGVKSDLTWLYTFLMQGESSYILLFLNNTVTYTN